MSVGIPARISGPRAHVRCFHSVRVLVTFSLSESLSSVDHGSSSLPIAIRKKQPAVALRIGWLNSCEISLTCKTKVTQKSPMLSFAQVSFWQRIFDFLGGLFQISSLHLEDIRLNTLDHSCGLLLNETLVRVAMDVCEMCWSFTVLCACWHGLIKLNLSSVH